MNGVIITAFICATIMGIAMMLYDLARKQMEVSEAEAKARALRMAERSKREAGASGRADLKADSKIRHMAAQKRTASGSGIPAGSRISAAPGAGKTAAGAGAAQVKTRAQEPALRLRSAGSIKGYYIGRDGNVQTVTGRSTGT